MEGTLSRLQAHSSRWQKALGVAFGEDRKPGGGLGSCSSSSVRVGDYEQENQIWGEYSKSTHQPPFYLPGLSHCSAGWWGLGHPGLSSIVGEAAGTLR